MKLKLELVDNKPTGLWHQQTLTVTEIAIIHPDTSCQSLQGINKTGDYICYVHAPPLKDLYQFHK